MKTEEQGLKSFFGEGDAVSTYTSDQAIEDGVLVKNFKQDRFPECNIVTRRLYDTLEKVACQRNLRRVFPYNPLELLGCLMVGAEEIYSCGKFEGDNDRDFFVMPKTDEGLVVWFVRNEQGKLTAMLPEDY